MDYDILPSSYVEHAGWWKNECSGFSRLPFLSTPSLIYSPKFAWPEFAQRSLVMVQSWHVPLPLQPINIVNWLLPNVILWLRPLSSAWSHVYSVCDFSRLPVPGLVTWHPGGLLYFDVLCPSTSCDHLQTGVACKVQYENDGWDNDTLPPFPPITGRAYRWILRRLTPSWQWQ